MFVYPEFREYIKEQVRRKGILRGVKTQLYRRDGSRIWVRFSISAVRGALGACNITRAPLRKGYHTSRKLAEKELQETMEELRRTFSGTIRAVSLMIETRDPYTVGHQRKVSSLARVIAQEMGFSSDEIDTIRTAGIIHDIGKIAVPAEILSKPTKLTDSEFSLIKAHPQTGYDIIKDTELPYPIAHTILQHHERINGSGYPQGLKGDEILLESRILTVADAVEAMASHLPTDLVMA